MSEIKSLDEKVFILSFYDYDYYDPAEHILDFYSSQSTTKRAKSLVRKAGLNLDFHVTQRTIKQLVEGAQKAQSGAEPIDLGYGKMCIEGHHWEYPWSDCYTSPDEIFERLDKSPKFEIFLPKQEIDRNSEGIDISGYDG